MGDLDGGEEGGEDTSAKEEGEERDSTALYGSRGPMFGGGCEFLYTQFELLSPVTKKNQIVLLKVPCVSCVLLTHTHCC